jgi:hypothetical protein
MEAATTQEALSATRQWLKPAIYVLLSCGVPWKEFAELAKSVYVEVATERFGKRGRPTNVSRTAVLTGLPRRDVRKQRVKLAAAGPAPVGYVTKASLILSAWHLDAEFTDKDKQGRPRVLPLEGETASFMALLKRCGGADVQPSTLLKELIRAGCVRQRADGRVQVLKRDYIPQTTDAQLVKLWGARLTDLATTYAHNMARLERETPRFERSAVNDRVPGSVVQEFRKVLEQEGQAFLERMDAWLTERQRGLSAEQAEAGLVRLGVGLYHIQD